MIQKAEPITAIEDEQQLYKDKEPELMAIVFRIARFYQEKGLLCDELANLGNVPEDMDYNLVFVQPRVMLTEEQRIDLAQKTKTLGFHTVKQIMQGLFPDMDEKEIDKQIEELGLIDFEMDAEGKQVMDEKGKPKVKPKAAAGAAAPGPGPVAAAKADTTIAEVSLNGTQVTAVLDILQRVVDEQLPETSARALLGAAFPSLTDAQVTAIMDPMKAFKATAKPVPPAFPPKPVPGPQDPPKPGPQDPPKPPPPAGA